MAEFNLVEETKTSMLSCLESYICEIIDSLKFENPDLSEKAVKRVEVAVEEAIDKAAETLELSMEEQISE